MWGLIPGSGRSPGGGHGDPLQYSSLKNPMDTEAWQAMVDRVAKSWTRLKQVSTHAIFSFILDVVQSFYQYYGSSLWCFYRVSQLFSKVMTLWMVRTYISLSLHMCSLVFGIKGISTNISGSISLPNFLSDTVLKLQVTQPSPDSVSPHLSEVTILCFVSPFLLYILHPGLQDHHRVLCICFPSVKEQNRMMPFC